MPPTVNLEPLQERRAELLEQIRDARESIGWLRAELRVLRRPKGLFARLWELV